MKYFETIGRVPRTALAGWFLFAFALVAPTAVAGAESPSLWGPSLEESTPSSARSWGHHGPRCGDGILDSEEICEPYEWIWVSIEEGLSLEVPIPRFNPCCSFRCDFRPAGTVCGDLFGGPRSADHGPPGCGGVAMCDGGGHCVASEAGGCDDGNPCTEDSCASNCWRKKGGQCKGHDRGGCVHVPIDCDDGVACTVDRCDARTGQCTHEPSDLACDDGVACTVDRCDASTGQCTHEPSDLACDDGLACTKDLCDLGSGSCLHEPQHALCDNGLFCDGQERCEPRASSSGRPADGVALDGCVAAAPVPCDDFVGCTEDRCDEELDRCLHLPSDALCDNGLFCDGSEVCDATNDCTAGVPIDCGDDAGQCTTPQCDESIDACSDVPTNEALPCDDGSVCTKGETCSAGTCGGGSEGVLGAACAWVAVGEGDERVRFRGGNQTFVRGDICMDTELVGTGSVIEGNIVATGSVGDKVLTFGFGSEVSGDVVTGGGGVQGQLGATLPHLPMGTAQVPPGTIRPMESPGTGLYDTTGSSPLVDQCVAARANLPAIEAAIAGVVDPDAPGYQEFDSVRVRQGRGEFRVVASAPGTINVAHFSMLALGSGAEMFLDGGGDDATVMVVVVDGRFSARANARIELVGGLRPTNVLLFSSGDRKCQLGSFSSFRGTIFCPNARLRVLAGARVEGAVLAGDAKLQIGDEAVLEYEPFTGF